MGRLLEIGQTHSINTAQPRRIRRVEDLFMQFVTDLHVPETGDRPRVDSFRLLYSILREIHCLPERREINAEIGEGFLLVGLHDGDRCWVTIGFDATFGTREFTTAQYLSELTTIMTDLSASIRAAGIDLDGLMQEFPPDLSP